MTIILTDRMQSSEGEGGAHQAEYVAITKAMRKFAAFLSTRSGDTPFNLSYKDEKAHRRMD